MADNTEPTPTKTFNFRMSDSRTSTEIDASTDMRSMIAIAKDTEDVTVITKTQKRNIPFDAESNAVDSVNGETGTVVLDTSHIDATTDRNYTTDAQQTLLGNTSGANTGDQDISGIGANASSITDIEAKTDFITVTQNVDLDTVESDTATNNGKVTNATHTGDVTGDTALTIADGVVTTSKISATGTPSASTFLRGDGSWETADSGGSNATSVQSVPVDTAPVGALAHLKTFIAKWYSNLFKYSEDISQSSWIKTSIIIDGTDGLIPSASLTTQRIFQTLSMTVGQSHYVKLSATKETTGQWVAIVTPMSSVAGQTYFDLVNGVVGNVASNVDNYYIESNGSGGYNIGIDFTSDTAAQSARFHVVSANGNPLGQGDGVAVHARLTKIQSGSGTLANNFPYIKTTTTAISKQQIDWVDASNKLKNIATGAYEFATLGNEYESPSQNGGFFGLVVRQFFEVTNPGASPHELIASGVKYPIGWGGLLYNSASDNSVIVGGYLDDLTNSILTVVDQGSTGQLVIQYGSTFDDASDMLKVYVDYVKQ